MSNKPVRLLALTGAILCVVSFFVPWVRTQAVREVLSIVEQLVRIASPEGGDVVGSVKGLTAISALQVVFGPSLIEITYRLLACIPLLLGLLLTLWSLYALSRGSVSRTIDLLFAGLSVAFVVLLAVSGPSIARLGTPGSFLGDLVYAAGYRLAEGFWMAVIGGGLIAVGAVLSAAGGQAVRRESTGKADKDPYR